MKGKKKMLKKTVSKIGRISLFLSLTFVLSGIICISAFMLYAKYSKELSISEFCTLAKSQDQTTKLYYMEYTDKASRSGTAVELESEALYGEQNREWVKYSHIPRNLINAFVAIEDHRFYEHDGIDIKRTAGAIIGFITGKSSFGGSTITQQLIKNVTGNDDYSVSRKVKEMIRAAKLDRALSKDEIMELYLNTIYLSERCYGIGSASERFFGKEPSELTLAECCALACIPQSPTKWSPSINPENNKSRRLTVLSRMLELEYISDEEYDQAISEEVIVLEKDASERSENRIYSWYTESVIDECIELLIEHKLATTTQTAQKLLYTGGLSVITAQNPKMQNEIEKYFSAEHNFYTPGMLIHPECSMVIIDPANGDILALCGAVGEKKANRHLNYATATERSPGSSIKPLSVYAPALDRGIITYGSVYDDTPVEFLSSGSRPWPNNYPNGFRGLTTVRDAVARSVNTVAVKILSDVGEENSFDLLYSGMNMKTLVRSAEKGGRTYTDIAASPLALGQLTVGVSVKTLTAGYTALANGGLYSAPRTVIKILDAEGNVLIDNSGESTRLFTPQTATIMTKLLQGVTSGGTANAMTLKKTVDCAGKTGTTNNDCDRWFVGYTPDLLAGVWFGYPTPKILDGFPTSPSPALKTFDAVMKLVNTEDCLGRSPAKRFSDAEGIITARYCRDSGKLATSACLCDPRGKRTETGYFTTSTAPKTYCDTHVMVKYDVINHGVAGADCPEENCKLIGMLNVNRSFPRDITISDAQYVYRRLPSGTPPCMQADKPFFYNSLSKGHYAGRSSSKLQFNAYCYECYLRSIAPPEEENYEDIESPPTEDS